MKQAAEGDGQVLPGGRTAVSAAFEGGEEISRARALARAFLTDLRARHRLPVSDHAVGMAQLVVSELVTNARKHAPGPCLLTLELDGDVVEITVWDTEPRTPVVRAADPQRVGQHGLEIVTAVCRDFEVHREPVGKRIKVIVALTDDQVGDMAGRMV